MNIPTSFDQNVALGSSRRFPAHTARNSHSSFSSGISISIPNVSAADGSKVDIRVEPTLRVPVEQNDPSHETKTALKGSTVQCPTVCSNRPQEAKQRRSSRDRKRRSGKTTTSSSGTVISHGSYSSIGSRSSKGSKRSSVGGRTKKIVSTTAGKTDSASNTCTLSKPVKDALPKKSRKRQEDYRDNSTSARRSQTRRSLRRNKSNPTYKREATTSSTGATGSPEPTLTIVWSRSTASASVSTKPTRSKMARRSAVVAPQTVQWERRKSKRSSADAISISTSSRGTRGVRFQARSSLTPAELSEEDDTHSNTFNFPLPTESPMLLPLMKKFPAIAKAIESRAGRNQD